MKTLNAVRFVLAFFVVAFQPPAVLLWVAIHPFASFWRRLGPAWTYSLLGIPVAGYVVAAWFFRDAMLGRDLGASPPLMVLAAVLAVIGSLLNRRRRKQLTFSSLSGMPELSARQYPGKLLTEGLYARMRHPRYVEIQFFVFAYALFANYTGAYLVAALSLLLLRWVVLLEERELRQRFGKEYEEYCRRVPRFIPRIVPGNRVGEKNTRQHGEDMPRQRRTGQTRLIVFIAPALGAIGYFYFQGMVPRALLWTIVALHGLIALAAIAAQADKRWALGILPGCLILACGWYAYALAMGLLGLAGGGLTDPGQRGSIFAYFAICLIGLGSFGWLVLGKKRHNNPLPDGPSSPSAQQDFAEAIQAKKNEISKDRRNI